MPAPLPMPRKVGQHVSTGQRYSLWEYHSEREHQVPPPYLNPRWLHRAPSSVYPGEGRMWTPAQAACTRSQHALRRVRQLNTCLHNAAVGSPLRPPRELCPSNAARMTVTLPATPGQSPSKTGNQGSEGSAAGTIAAPLSSIIFAFCSANMRSSVSISASVKCPSCDTVSVCCCLGSRPTTAVK